MARQGEQTAPTGTTGPADAAAVAQDPARGWRVGYIRVSTLDQKTERQLDGVDLDRVFTDKASGRDANRPQLQAALEHVRDRYGDTLVVHSMDRLARNLDDLRRIVRELTARGVAVEFIKERLVFRAAGADPMATLLLSVMGAFAEFERSLIRERQREGIAIAKQRGAYKGRKPALDAARVAELRSRDEAQGRKNRASLAREFGISRETLYQYLRG